MLHLARWNFARTCTFRSLVHVKVKGQVSRSHGFLCASQWGAVQRTHLLGGASGGCVPVT